MAVITQFNTLSYLKTVNGYSLPFSSSSFSATLTPNTNTSIAVPLGSAMGVPSATSFNKFIVQIKYSQDNNGDLGDVWVALNNTAEIPAGNSFLGTKSILRPEARQVKAGDVLNFITANTSVSVSVEFFAVQPG